MNDLRSITLPAAALAWLVDLASRAQLSDAELNLLDRIDRGAEDLTGPASRLRPRAAKALGEVPVARAPLLDHAGDEGRLRFMQDSVRDLIGGRITMDQASVELGWVDDLLSELLGDR